MAKRTTESYAAQPKSTMETKVVHCKKEPFDVLIDRSTKWGNPFVIGEDGTRKQVIKKYEKLLQSQINKNPQMITELLLLKGKTLGCWCKPESCHGDVLANIIDGLDYKSNP